MSESDSELKAPELQPLEKLTGDLVYAIICELDSLRTLNHLVQSHKLFWQIYSIYPESILRNIVNRCYPREALYCLSLARQHSLGGYSRKYYQKDVGLLGVKDITLTPLPQCRVSSNPKRGCPEVFFPPSPGRNSPIRLGSPEPSNQQNDQRRAKPGQWLANKDIDQYIDWEKIGVAEAKWLIRADKEVEETAVKCILHPGSLLQETLDQLQEVKTRIYVLYRLMAQFCWVQGDVDPGGQKRVHGVYDYTLACRLHGGEIKPLIDLARTLAMTKEHKKRLACPIVDLLEDLQKDYEYAQDLSPTGFSLLTPYHGESHELEEIKDDTVLVSQNENETEPVVSQIPWPMVHYGPSAANPGGKWVFQRLNEVRSNKEKPRETMVLVREPARCWKLPVVRRSRQANPPNQPSNQPDPPNQPDNLGQGGPSNQGGASDQSGASNQNGSSNHHGQVNHHSQAGASNQQSQPNHHDDPTHYGHPSHPRHQRYLQTAERRRQREERENAIAANMNGATGALNSNTDLWGASEGPMAVEDDDHPLSADEN